MEMIQQWKPTVGISHAEGCVTNAVISQGLAQKIFRLVTDELNGTEEGPQSEEKPPEHCKTNCRGMAGLGRPFCYSLCSAAPPKIVTKARDTEKPIEVLRPESDKYPLCSPNPECETCEGGLACGGTPGKLDVEICAVEDCDTEAMEGHGVCEHHGGGEPKGIPNEETETRKCDICGKPWVSDSMGCPDCEEEQLPLCQCGCEKPVTKEGNRFLQGHGGKKAIVNAGASAGVSCKNCGSTNLMKYGKVDLKKGGFKQKWMCKDCNRVTSIKHKDTESAPEEKKEESKSAPKVPIPAIEPKEDATPEPTSSADYSHCMKVNQKPEDLMIIRGMVMCPQYQMAKICDKTGCTKYIATVKVIEEDNEPHIRCTAAGRD